MDVHIERMLEDMKNIEEQRGLEKSRDSDREMEMICEVKSVRCAGKRDWNMGGKER